MKSLRIRTILSLRVGGIGCCGVHQNRVGKKVRVRDQNNLLRLFQHRVAQIDIRHFTIEAAHRNVISGTEWTKEQQQNSRQQVREYVAECEAQGKPGKPEASDQSRYIHAD